jgi:hypothetical protein
LHIVDLCINGIERPSLLWPDERRLKLGHLSKVESGMAIFRGDSLACGTGYMVGCILAQQFVHLVASGGCTVDP